MIAHRRPRTQTTTGQRGVAMIEMAVVVSLLAVLLLGIVTIGVTLGFRQSMTQATDDAARAAAFSKFDIDEGAAVSVSRR